jgi:hypothetical protein
MTSVRRFVLAVGLPALLLTGCGGGGDATTSNVSRSNAVVFDGESTSPGAAPSTATVPKECTDMTTHTGNHIHVFDRGELACGTFRLFVNTWASDCDHRSSCSTRGIPCVAQRSTGAYIVQCTVAGEKIRFKSD